MGSSIIPKVLPSIAHPITSLEFTNALLSTWRQRSYQERAIEKLGLAISGGVDSMALAVLCSKIQDHPSNTASAPVTHRLKFQAFVVDHGVREGSDHEAEAVSKVLEKKGISTTVLKIDWDLSEEPGKRPNFETLARKYRFQVLGKACKEHGIDSLFLAHHEDDQAETVMMRMINGHRVLGLYGMKGESRIPECHGLYGVYQSGGIGRSPHTTSTSSTSSTVLGLKDERPRPLVIERGGIKVYRPLLVFRKARLIATCQTENMEWFEDHTNEDPSVTMRNAVRHIFRSTNMPAALNPESIIQLSKKCNLKDSLLNGAAQELLEMSFASNFDTRAGTLTIRFANMDQIDLSAFSQSSSDRGLIAALLLRQVVTFVTPDENVHLFSLHGAVKRIFPEIFGQPSANTLPAAFTVSGVRFQPLYPQRDKASHQYQRFKWLVTRQPHSSVASARPLIRIPPSENGEWSTWELYDGRFWIRVRNSSLYSILIRPFHKDDLKTFKQTLVGRELLKKHAPELVRWTLPAIAACGQNGQEKLLALPTLDIAAPGIEKHVSWEVRYKNVDVETLCKSGLCVVR